MKRYVVAAMLVMGLAGCATTETYDETRGWTVEKLYSEARDELNSGNYTRAVKLYETLEARYPYGRYAQQAEMDRPIPITRTMNRSWRSPLPTALSNCIRHTRMWITCTT